MIPRIYADFNKMDGEGRLILICAGTHQDLQKANLELKDGLELLFYMDDGDEQGNSDDIEVPGIVRFDDSSQKWVGIFDPKTLRHVSESQK